VTGEFDSGATFTSTNLTSAGGTDIFVARLGNEIAEPVRLAIRKIPDVVIDVTGAPGALVELEAAATLKAAAWLPLTNITLTTNSASVSYLADGVQRFYRARVLP
jgi:hypothetical protein